MRYNSSFLSGMLRYFQLKAPRIYPDHTSVWPPNPPLLAVAILASIAIAGGLSVIAWSSALILYADGALFSFVVGVDDAWALVWHVIPARSAAYVLTMLPAETALERGLSAPAAMRLYQALFLALPFMGAGACLFVIPRSSCWMMVFPTMSLLALAMLPLGFPTETLVMLAAFWPAIFGYRFASGGSISAIFGLFWTGVLMFSHPGMLLTLPLLFLAGIFRWRECHAPEVRRVILIFGCTATLTWGLWLWCFAREMSDPGTIQSAQSILSPGLLWQLIRLDPGILIILLCVLLWGGMAWVRNTAASLTAAALLIVVAILFALIHRETVAPETHYYARTAIILILPIFGALALWRGRSAPSGLVTLALVAALAMTQLRQDVAFLQGWRNLRDSVADSVTKGPPRIVPLAQVLAGGAEPNGESLAWSWGQPFLSLTLPNASHYLGIVADPAPQSYMPLHCSQMDDVLTRASWVPSETLALLRAYVCARRPD
jgi:hypothetical protein